MHSVSCVGFKKLFSLFEIASDAVSCVGFKRLFSLFEIACDAQCACVGFKGLCFVVLTQYLEKMQLLYNEKAREAGLYIVGACGFDSIPADLGVLFTRNSFKGQLRL